MKTNKKKSILVKLSLIIVTSFLTLNLAFAQEEYLSFVVKTDCTTETVNLTSQIIYVKYISTENTNDEEEPSAEIEDWMFDLKLWHSTHYKEEEEAEIENWMFSTNFWSNNIANTDEEELEIEYWMLSTNLWANNTSENELSIENWMLSADYWKN